MVALPPLQQLIGRCKALATLDLILSPNWQSRFYSFNAHWSREEMMASMRDGCGDEWWLVFHNDGWAALKGLDHESPAWSRHGETLSTALQRAFPEGLKQFATEPDFRWKQTSFAYFHPVGAADWTCVNDLIGHSTEDAGDAGLLAHLIGSAASYAAFASDYYETEVDVNIVANIFALQPITAKLVHTLNQSISMVDIAEELYNEIQYPDGNELNSLA